MSMTTATVDLHSLRTVLARYDAAEAAWRQANETSDGAPGVRDAERYSEALEHIAHAFAAVLRETVEREDAAEELAEAVEAAGIEPHDLDDVVHDAASNPASDANNGGTEAQVALLVAQYGLAAARATIEQATGRTLAPADTDDEKAAAGVFGPAPFAVVDESGAVANRYDTRAEAEAALATHPAGHEVELVENPAP